MNKLKTQENGTAIERGQKVKYNKLALTLITGVGLLLSGCAEVRDYTGKDDTFNFSDLIKDEKSEFSSENSNTNNGVEVYTSTEDLLTYTYTGKPFVNVEDGKPDFTPEEIERAKTSFEEYNDLDGYGRCTQAFASVGQDIMPTKKRGSISSVKPTGWQTTKYDNISGKYLYNRCHLIGYQLTGENANKENLITGTRYLNIDGMLDTEDSVADYVKKTGNHVLYRVTPVFNADEAVARGVRMEGYSVEDGGEGISFDLYAFNVQPGMIIDYTDGSSSLE